MDTALAADLLHWARSDPREWALILAEDDDLIPPVFTAESWIKPHGGRVFICAQTTEWPLSEAGRLVRGVEQMTTEVSLILEELALFADLGTDRPRVTSNDDRVLIGMIREGEQLEIGFDRKVGKVTERSLDSRQIRHHASYRSLLASDRFGNLRQWTNNQRQALRGLKSAYKRRIPIAGVLSTDETELDVHRFANFLVGLSDRDESSARVALIDGPAGIGKTRFIEFLAWLRAERYFAHQHPLILHVQSRGRVLTYLQDLIAFSLQRLRLNVTFDQVPVLVRHGLVTLAIDGFDELADPNGYELAWGQLGELVDQIRGHGTLILAGRETFIGQDRIRKSIRSLRSDDPVHALTLQPPRPDDAKTWLRAEQGNEREFPAELFEPGSFALRPFFLIQLSVLPPEAPFGRPQQGPLLASLVEAMIRREAGKFGDAVEAVMTVQQRLDYVCRFLREVARYMADDQTEAIDELALSWIAEVAAPEGLDEETVKLLQYRASVMAFLENDDTPRYRRFSHSNLFNHFLGEEVLDAVAREDLPKWVRRNILGADFLAVFSDLTVNLALRGSDRIGKFYESAVDALRKFHGHGRAPHNLGALLITMLPAMEDSGALIIQQVQADEALIRGTAPTTKIQDSDISQLDVQGSNVEHIEFSGVNITTLTVDETTHVSRSMPIPSQIQYNRIGVDRRKVISRRKEIESWLSAHGRILESEEPVADGSGLVPKDLRRHPVFRLLNRACRSRSFWIPDGSTNFFEKFTRDHRWPDLLALMEQHDLVKVTTMPAAGTNNRFYHITQPIRILSEDVSDVNVRRFYEELVAMVRGNP